MNPYFQHALMTKLEVYDNVVVCVLLFNLLMDHGLTCLFNIAIMGGGASPTNYTKLPSFCYYHY